MDNNILCINELQTTIYSRKMLTKLEFDKEAHNAYYFGWQSSC